MLTTDDQGQLIYEGAWWEKTPYDMGNTRVLCQADGAGGLSRYAVAGGCRVFVPNSFYAALSVNGQGVPAVAPKRVEMLGSKQLVELKGLEIGVQCLSFLGADSSVVYQQYTLINSTGQGQKFELNFGFLVDTAEFARHFSAKAGQALGCDKKAEGLYYNEVVPGQGVVTACSEALILREIQDVGAHYTTELVIPPEKTVCLKLAFAIGPKDMRNPMEGFEIARQQAEEYSKWLIEAFPEGGEYRAQFASCLNTILSSYKETEDFSGFFAGVNYSYPPRTYFRDGYYTALAALEYRPDWVRNQLCTLVEGIDEQGRCPSAVIGPGRFFWPDHLDAPQFFMLLLDAYVQQEGAQLLNVPVRGKPMLEWARLCTDGLLARADHTGLLPREKGNRHDWADNVYREGYVTYVQALFCGAVKSFGRLLAAGHQEGASEYLQKAGCISKAIEKYLWLEDKGWYANYVSENCVEDNLSIDTVLLVWLDIIEDSRARQLLKNMERYLETAHNPAQLFGSWGTMCCWPPYKYKAHLVEKSSYDFVYHNGADWPYWSCVYGMCKLKYGMDGEYPITKWFRYGMEHNWCTPVEYYSPAAEKGSNLQGWSGIGALAVRQLAKEGTK